MEKKEVKISFVIPNWNGIALLRSHLSHVLANAEGAEVIVVDDASTDDSLNFLKKNFPSVRVIAKEKHEGFSSTVNAGLFAARGEIVILLNTDVEPEKGFLKPLLVHFSDPLVFAVGCMDKSIEHGKIVLRGRGEASWKKGFYIHWRGEVDKKNTAWVSGGSGAFRKSIWEKIGGMDSIYNPFYWEDIDLSYRALKAGYKLVFEPKSVVKHFHEEGKIKQNYSMDKIQQIAYRNQFIFIWKNLSDWKILFSHVFWTPIRLIQGLLRWDKTLLMGYVQACCLLPRIFMARINSSRMWKKKDCEIL